VGHSEENDAPRGFCFLAEHDVAEVTIQREKDSAFPLGDLEQKPIRGARKPSGGVVHVVPALAEPIGHVGGEVLVG